MNLKLQDVWLYNLETTLVSLICIFPVIVVIMSRIRLHVHERYWLVAWSIIGNSNRLVMCLSDAKCSLWDSFITSHMHIYTHDAHTCTEV